MYWIAIIALKYAACAFSSELRYSRAGIIANAEERDSTRMEISLRCTRLYVEGKKRPRGAILFELENIAYTTLVFFFQDYMLGYGGQFDREYICAVLSSSKEHLDAGDKLAIYLTGKLWCVTSFIADKQAFHIIVHGACNMVQNVLMWLHNNAFRVYYVRAPYF